MDKRDLVEDLEHRIKLLVCELSPHPISPENVPLDVPVFEDFEDPVESLGLDSLALLELDLGLRRHYGVSIPDDADPNQLRTIRQIVDFVAELILKTDARGSLAE